MITANKVSRRRFLAGASGLAAAGLLVPNRHVRAMPSMQAATPKRGGHLTILETNDFVSMDPIHAGGPTAHACYDWLLAWRSDDNGQYGVQPMLATSWKAEGNALTFKLRDGIKFHDGSDLNADVVVWNVNRMVQTSESFAKDYLTAIDAKNPAQAIDPMTVQVNLTRQSAGALASLSDAVETTAIVSKKAADDHGEEWLKTNAVGTGPYKFVSWRSGDKLEVERNDAYWQMGADGKPMPYTDAITYRIIIDVSTQFTEMRAGTADLMMNVPGRNVPAAKDIPSAQYGEAPYLGLKHQYFFNALKPPFKDNLKLRQAVHYAVDRAAMAKAIDANLGQPMHYELVKGETGFDDSAPYYEFDLDKAKALIKDSGVKTPLDVRMTVHNREVDQQQGQLMQAMLDKIGIKVNLDVVERVAWVQKVRIQNDFEMATRRAEVVVDPTNELLITWSPADSYSSYSRATVPGLLDTIYAADAAYDDEKRHQLYVKAQQLMHDSAWFGFTWFATGNYLIDKRVQNFPVANGQSTIWGSLREWEWWINE